jgi:hypothetical protein
MNKEHTKALVERYPEFFEYLKDYKGPLMPITFGFECGDGWFAILDELMGDIKNHVENENRNRKHRFRHLFPSWLKSRAYWRLPHKRKYLKKFLIWIADLFPKGVPPMSYPNITQIKEKFGGLRFYIDGGDDTIYGMISLAESMSYRTCEYCGTTGNNVGQTQGWIITVCEDCYKKEERLEGMTWKLHSRVIPKEVKVSINPPVKKKTTKNERKRSSGKSS